VKGSGMDKKRRERGLLILTLGFVAFVFTLGMVLYSVIESSRMQIIQHKQRVAAQYCADAGLDYGRYMIGQRRWTGRSLYKCSSPAIGSSGWFTVVCERAPSGRMRITSTGYATSAIHVEKSCEVSGGE